jgi:hypothetical protein
MLLIRSGVMAKPRLENTIAVNNRHTKALLFDINAPIRDKCCV